jgi:hypothetical protein
MHFSIAVTGPGIMHPEARWDMVRQHVHSEVCSHRDTLMEALANIGLPYPWRNRHGRPLLDDATTQSTTVMFLPGPGWTKQMAVTSTSEVVYLVVYHN